MERTLVMDSPIGPLTLQANENGITRLDFGRTGSPGARGEDAAQAHLDMAEKQLHLYFAGKLKKFDVHLDIRGADFHRKVWEQLLSIPYGQYLTYGEIAHILQRGGAARAVGQACGANPIAIIVPCHRVLAQGGGLGGFGGGLPVKKWLLDHEGVVYKG